MGTAFDDEFAGLILKFSGSAGIHLTEKQALLLSRHIRIMLEWNSRLNLTRITEPEEIIIKHLLDSILPAKFLPSSGYALDVGTGAGFPGIPLKIVYPDLHMLLLDSNRKKNQLSRRCGREAGAERNPGFAGQVAGFPEGWRTTQ